MNRSLWGSPYSLQISSDILRERMSPRTAQKPTNTPEWLPSGVNGQKYHAVVVHQVDSTRSKVSAGTGEGLQLLLEFDCRQRKIIEEAGKLEQTVSHENRIFSIVLRMDAEKKSDEEIAQAVWKALGQDTMPQKQNSTKQSLGSPQELSTLLPHLRHMFACSRKGAVKYTLCNCLPVITQPPIIAVGDQNPVVLLLNRSAKYDCSPSLATTVWDSFNEYQKLLLGSEQAVKKIVETMLLDAKEEIKAGKLSFPEFREYLQKKEERA